MPTGAGKTALTEVIAFSHLIRHTDDVVVLIVPYRALASELRESLVRHLTQMGFSARSAYGGAIPSSDEVQSIDGLNVLVATPETLTGIVSAAPDFLRRIGLVICDEGHLLDGPTRGVSLELLLARLRAREGGAPRFVFISAIVPNIEEVNAWLGGTDETVVRSEYRPAVAEWAVLNPSRNADEFAVELRFHPHQAVGFEIAAFLSRRDFRYRNARTGRLKTYGFSTVKTQAVATARKALQMGAVAIFAANKRGDQGCVGLAEELLNQLAAPLALPTPEQFVSNQGRLRDAVEYLTLEYGSDWIGTRALGTGAVVHHGDVPQETREVLEGLLRRRILRMALCTSTLAEGVNLPIRTIVLYSLQRRDREGRPQNLLERDIKNLVGRAGRAGATTKGLVVCANPRQWGMIEPVANQSPGEPVKGALLTLMRRLQRAVVARRVVLSNELLERSAVLHALVDGVDAALVDLVAEELDQEDLLAVAAELAADTYAARGAEPQVEALMRSVFELRATRVLEIRAAGRLQWLRETGARARMLGFVETRLYPAREQWDAVPSATDAAFIELIVQWAWGLPGFVRVFRDASRMDDADERLLGTIVSSWIAGLPLKEVARRAGLGIDDTLAIHSRVISYELHSAVEQGIALLTRLCANHGKSVAPAVTSFPDNLRFGVPNDASRLLSEVLRHRRAAVVLGGCRELAGLTTDDTAAVVGVATELATDVDRWLPELGELVLSTTVDDLLRFGRRSSHGATE